MIQLSAIVDGRPSVMLTGATIEEARRSCRDRFGCRFDGFAPIPPETKARSAWSQYRGKEITRAELEGWLAEQEDEQEIRAELNRIMKARG